MSMKFIVEFELERPTQDEIKAVAGRYNPIKPKSALLITLFVDGYDEKSKEVFRLMKYNYGGYDRKSIALDVACAYCDENNIKDRTLRVIGVTEYPSHFVIEALATF